MSAGRGYSDSRKPGRKVQRRLSSKRELLSDSLVSPVHFVTLSSWTSTQVLNWHGEDTRQ